MTRGNKLDKNLLVNTLIEHLKEQHAEGEEWVNLTAVKASAILGVGGTTACFALRDLRQHEEVEAVEIQGKVTNRTPYKYRYVGKVIKTPEIKEVKEEVKSPYKNLTTAEVDYITAKLKYVVGNEDISPELKIANALVSIKNNNNVVSNYANQISDLLLMPAMTARTYVNLFERAGLARVDRTNVTLMFSAEAREKYLYPESPAETKKTLVPAAEKVQAIEVKNVAVSEQKPRVILVDMIEDKPRITLVEEPVQTGIEATVVSKAAENNNEAILKMLLENVQDFKGFLGGFMNFWGESEKNLQSLGNGDKIRTLQEANGNLIKEKFELQDRVIYLENELEKGSLAAQKLLTDNSTLRDTIVELKKEVKLERSHVASCREVNTKIFETMNENFQILLAEITNSLSDYFRLPAWKKELPSERASVQNQIVKAVNATIDTIIANNNNHKEE